MKLGPLVVLGSVSIVVVGAMFYFGIKLARAIERKAPAEMSAKVTRTGLALYGCMTVVLTVFMAAATLEPDGLLGSFLRSPGGLVAALLGTVAFFSIMAWLFDKIGYPISGRGKSE